MQILKLPGLIDIHVHMRDPGQTEKEDFYTATSAAVAGGFTTILDMPNNKMPITTLKRLEEKINIAAGKIVCDVGFYIGSMADNYQEFEKVKGKIFGLKLFLNQTTGNLMITEKEMNDIYLKWQNPPAGGPILVHSEGDTVAKILKAVKKTGKKTHLCHISEKAELKLIIKAKESGLPVTCGVTPHHLFLNETDVDCLGSFAMMKPPLRTKKDVDYLWTNLKYIDVVESDHAPHTISEKNGDKPPFGVPGLETTLPLLLTAQREGRITMDKILDMLYYKPKKIFNIQTDKNTKIEVDLNKVYTIKNKNLKTKCGWSPFDGFKVRGEVKKVVIRGKKVYENGRILVEGGFGRVIVPLDIEKNKDKLFKALVEIAKIPSPTGLENNKIHFLKKKLTDLNLQNIHIDSAGNCIGELPNSNQSKKTILIVAHSDTACKVNEDGVSIKEDDKYIYGHSICDNTAGVVGILTTLELINKFNITFRHNLIFAFTVGEEGIGGKRGMKEIIKKYGKKIDAVINIESHNIGRLTHKSIGQFRVNISVDTKKGGHSFRDFGVPNAIVILSNIISSFSKYKLPQKLGKTTFNVGKIEGGEGVNVIPAKASVLFEIRSENPSYLKKAKEKLQLIINLSRKKYPDIEIAEKIIAENIPSSIPKSHRLCRLTAEVQKNLGIKTKYNSGNSDGDISLANNIPTVTIGASVGYNTHSFNEYLEKDSLALGIKQVFMTIFKIASEY